MFDVNWGARSHAAIWDEVTARSGDGFTDAGAAWNTLAGRLADVATSVERATAGIRATRSGTAAEAAQGAVGPMAPWVEQARGLADAVGSVSHEQSRAFADTAAAMPPPVTVPQGTTTVDPHTWEGVFGGDTGVGWFLDTDADVAEHARADAERRARELMTGYQDESALRAATLPQFAPPAGALPAVSAAPPPAADSGGHGATAGDLAPVAPPPVAVAGGPASAAAPASRPVAGSPGAGPHGGGATGGGAAGGGTGPGPGAPTGAGATPAPTVPSAAGTAGVGDHAGGRGPNGDAGDRGVKGRGVAGGGVAGGGVAGGGGAGGGGAAPDGDVPGTPIAPPGAGSGAYGSTPGRSTPYGSGGAGGSGVGARAPGLGAPGPGGRSSAYGGSGSGGSGYSGSGDGSGAGDPPGAGLRGTAGGATEGVAGRAPVIPGEPGVETGARTGVGGSVLEPALGRGAGAPSGGRTAMPFAPLGGAVGGHGDREHRRADYLTEDDPDAITGTLPWVAPPVIGE